ncbi:MAG: 2-oxoglutarate and iron-dependent oxygenase domain-containing protein [Pseudomonadota bacterium]
MSYDQAAEADFDAIPVVDVTGIHDDANLPAIGEALVAAAQASGFFYLSGHGVKAGLRADAFAASRRFFALPEAEKATVAVDQTQRGWMATGMTKFASAKVPDAKEVFFWGWDYAADDPDLLAGAPLMAHNKWPDGAGADLRDGIEPYYLETVALGRRVLAALAVGLGRAADFFEAAFANPLARGQLVYYPPMDDADRVAERFGAAPHTDFGTLTMLAQDNTGGLQVLSPSGAWVEAPPIPDTYVCNIGDLLQHWTAGQLKSTVHRVINRCAGERYSIPVFCDPASRWVIDPSDFGGAVDAVPLTAGEHIAKRNAGTFSQYKA